MVVLSDVLVSLERLAPLRFAEPWDNVGLLIEPGPLTTSPPVERALLTIDLSEAVLDEAEALGAQLIIAYHPPIFSGFKRLRASHPGERLVLRCAKIGISVFSPHTALDAAPAGVNDWLLEAFGTGVSAPCVAHPLDARYGQGRSLTLAQPMPLGEAVTRVKKHLGLAQVRLSSAAAHAAGALIQKVAVCAGAGGSVFEKISGYDLYVTGEMRHHDVRERAAAGASVILCEHTNTERGFLPTFAARLSSALEGRVRFEVSSCDRDPLSIV